MVCGYIRPEASFTSLEALIERIHEDGRISGEVLAQPPLKTFSSDAFLQPSGT